MDTLSYKTLTPNEQQCNREWVVIDATDQVLGRLCSVVAMILRGKNKPTYSPFVECGDNVIIINADKVRLTGNKWTDREYLRYTGYPGGQRVSTPELLQKKGMLPKNRLGRQIIENMHVYNGPAHPHEAQNPKVIDINTIK